MPRPTGTTRPPPPAPTESARRFGDACLRGVGQIVFANSPLSGALVLGAMLTASPWLGAAAALGVVSSTATARLLRLHGGRTRAGLYGYNGALVGAAFAAFLSPAWSAGVAAAIVAAAAVSTIVMVATSGVMVGVLGLPPLTLPFNFVALPCLMFTLSTSRVGRAPGLGAVVEPVHAIVAATFSPVPFLSTIVRGVGQIVLADGVAAGALVLAAVAVVSRVGVLFALLGSALGALLALALGADHTSVTPGLWGYNAFVTAQAIGAVFLRPSWSSSLYAATAAVTATVLGGAMSIALSPVGMPILTLPFCFATLPFLLATRATPLFESVHVSESSSDE